MTDARDAGPRKCSWLGCGALERIGHPCSDRYCPQQVLDVRAARAAGYRILAPDALDPVTLERAAKVVEASRGYGHTDWGEWHNATCDDLAAEIRSLASREDAG